MRVGTGISSACVWVSLEVTCIAGDVIIQAEVSATTVVPGDDS